MEAPEKIYLEWYRVGDIKYREWVITPNTNNEPIQYTRTDAFIDKAAKWINEHTSLSQKLIIENFVNYIKGE